jgi:hypothetical protein
MVRFFPGPTNHELLSLLLSYQEYCEEWTAQPSCYLSQCVGLVELFSRSVRYCPGEATWNCKTVDLAR